MSKTPTIISFPFPGQRIDCHRTLVKIDPRQMSYVVSIIEGHDHIGIARTINQGEGTMEILVSPDFVDQIKGVLEALVKEIGLIILRP